MLSSKALKVRETIRAILSDPAELLQIKQDMAQCLLEIIREDYIKKSKGEPGAGGLRWEATKTGRDIMVHTSRLLDSLEIVHLPDGSVGVHFGIFPPENDSDRGRLIALQQRPAWPEQLPTEWLTAVTDVLKQHLLHRLIIQPGYNTH